MPVKNSHVDCSGQTFNLLTLIKRVEDRKVGKNYRPFYLCKCVCGTLNEVCIDRLKAKGRSTKSCGCLKKMVGQMSSMLLHEKDLVGKKIGRLLVLSPDIEKKSQGARFICRCDCGKIKSIKFSNFKDRPNRSCGCWSKEIFRVNRLKRWKK